MYSKAEATQLREAFWTAFGHYMAPIPGAEGTKVNWSNYKTGLKHVYFRMRADTKAASIAIELTHPDAGIRELFYEQFQELKTLLEETTGETWNWQPNTTDDHSQPIARIGTKLPGVNLFSKDDWPALISFFKPRIIALDEFWSNAQYSFDALRG